MDNNWVFFKEYNELISLETRRKTRVQRDKYTQMNDGVTSVCFSLTQKLIDKQTFPTPFGGGRGPMSVLCMLLDVPKLVSFIKQTAFIAAFVR